MQDACGDNFLEVAQSLAGETLVTPWRLSSISQSK